MPRRHAVITCLLASSSSCRASGFLTFLFASAVYFLSYNATLSAAQLPKMKILVQHGKEGHNVSCEQEETIGDLMVKVRETTGIFEGHQKLIYKGKTLDAKLTLAQAKMKDGTKVMLIASSTPVQTQACHIRISVIDLHCPMPIDSAWNGAHPLHLLIFYQHSHKHRPLPGKLQRLQSQV